MNPVWVRLDKAISILGDGGNRYRVEKLADLGKIRTKQFPGMKQRMYHADDVGRMRRESELGG